MKIKVTVSFAVLFLFCFTYIYAADFKYSAGIVNEGDKKYKAVRLTAHVYNNISENMSDLAILDKQNEQVPYFINSFIESEIETKRAYELKQINSFIKDDYYYYDYTLKTPVTEDVAATSIGVHTGNTGFAKKVELLGSYDNINWEKVQEDTLYNVDGSSRLEISFDGTKKYTCYRFRIFNNLEKVEFTSVSLNYNNVIQKRDYFIETISPEYAVEEQGNVTVVRVKGLKNLRLNNITVKTDSIFKRNVTFNNAAYKMLYYLEFKNIRYKDLTIPLDFQRVEADDAEIKIENNDDKPIKITGIEVEYTVYELVFEDSKAGGYFLKYGNEELKTPKSYDISNYKEQILNEGYDKLNLTINKTQNSSVSPKTSTVNYKLIFNITILMVAVIMGVIILKKLKK
ncbi:MAG: hypothetical protein K0R50_592 [Eubacterium sp.]|jgi:hypothetical protein|nr:hypothetical protein [Eubacterium sp.]